MRSQRLVAKMSGRSMLATVSPGVGQKEERKMRVVRRRVRAVNDSEEKKRAGPTGNTVDTWIRRMQDDGNGNNSPEREDNEGAFVYLRQSDPEDPYSLIYCTYKDAEQHGGRFYTLSKKGFTSYFGGRATEFLSTVEWVMERELYGQIKSFAFFKLFRLWRAIRSWRHNVFSERRRAVKETLERRLMLAKKGYAELLVQHRASCRRLETRRLFDVSESDEVLTLKQFEQMQEAHMKKAAAAIQEVSERTKERFLHKIAKTIDRLKRKIRASLRKAEEERESSPQRAAGLGNAIMAQALETHQRALGSMSIRDVALEHLGFQQNLSYAHRTDVRKECKMFLRFSYLLDFIAKTSLKEMYVNSMRTFDRYLQQHTDVNIPAELPILKTVPEFALEKTTKPVVLFQIAVSDRPVAEDEIKYELVSAYEKPPVGRIDEASFDPTCHLQLVDDYQEGAADVSPGRVIIGKKVRSAYVNEPAKRWLTISPALAELGKMLKRCVRRMLEALASYARHSRCEALDQYARVLEEWDEKMVRKCQVSADKKLRCEDLLETQPEYVGRESLVDRHMLRLGENIQKYLALFSGSLLRCWRYSRIPWDRVTSSCLREPVDVITLLVRQIRIHKEEFALRIPNKADIGFCRLNMQAVRERLTAAPAQAFKKLDFIIVSLSLWDKPQNSRSF